jgi:SAM-dependent methyltransferase
MSSSEWKQIPDQYVRIGDARMSQVYPPVLRTLLSNGTSRLLDYGCGDGRFSAVALQAGMSRVVLYDPSPRMRELATETVRPWGEHASVIERVEQIDVQAFDAVVWNAVWMCMPSRAECIESLKRAHAALRPGRMFVASVTHPCFRDRQFSTYRTSFEMHDYAREGAPFQVTMFDGTNAVHFTDYHWSLSAMSEQLRAAGLSLVQLVEIPDAETTSRTSGVPWLVMVARK